jgi:hypothetical protein
VTATRAEAVDQVFALVSTAWGSTGPIDWPDKVQAAGVVFPPTAATPWLRARLQYLPAGQGSLAGAGGARMWDRVGVLTIQVFSPRGSGLPAGFTLAKILEDALEGAATPGQVWFRNVHTRHVGADGMFNQFNVIAEFEHNEVK